MATAHAVEPGAKTRILVADDDPDILGLLAFVLRKAGYEVVTAPHGGEALRMARETEPDLVLLDVSMPVLNGYEVCEQLVTSVPDAPPVIFLTAHGHSSARVQGLDAGAVDYVVKPFDAQELTARVRAALRTKAARDMLAAEASTDALTGLLNRSQLYSRAAEAVSLARRHNRPLACIMVDLDHFKKINDTYGHAAGDAVLREAAQRLRTVGRVSDVVVRYGGEEFLVLLPETDIDGAAAIAERIRTTLSATPIRVEDALGSQGWLDLTVTASLGIATWDGETMDGPNALLAVADGALYRAKQNGRDRVERG
ncbi:MAG: diguanylate cyclase [Thermoleophilia bacterium]